MSTLDPTIIIRAGGLVPTSAKVSSDVRVGTVAARRYTHEAIPGRTVVRLVPDAMAPGADVEMDTLGFGKGEVSAALGKGRLRALGFPGWALINDPARASFALEVMKDFKKAAKQIRSKPGNARDAFIEIGARLARSVPHFLPSFWEEAGRRFLAEESTTFAAQSFEKARLAEKEHALKVDEDTRSAAYLEFALAGAVAAKSLTGYAKELQEAYGAEAAYARYLELATRRVLGGMPPWTGLAKELRGLAKAAKKNLDAEDEAFLSAVLDAPAIARAPGELWTTYDAAIVRLAKKSPALQRRLRHLFPHPSSQNKDFETWWFTFLGRAGALEGLWEATEGEPELAEWLSKMIRFTNASAELYALLPKLAPRLVREGKPVQVGTKQGRKLSLDFAETLLTLGASVAEPNNWMNFNLTEAITVDPVRVEADPVLGPRLLRAVETALGDPAFEAASVGKVGLARARRAWLAREVERLSGGGVFGVGAACTRLATKVRPALWAEHPDLVAAAKSANVADALARTLRGGVFAEWTWPAFEELHAKKLGALTFTGAWPFPVYHTATKAFVLGANGIILEHDFVLPPKARADRSLYIDGDLFVVVNTPGASTRAYWASNPQDLFDLESYLYWYDFPTAIALPEGGATMGDRAIHRGDREIKVGPAVSGDGTGVWIAGHEDGRFKLYELDPKTGTKGRASWPSFMTDAVAAEEHDKLRIQGASFAPAPPGVEASPLGQRDGVVGAIVRGPAMRETGVRQFRRIDGARWERQGTESPRALISWPGDSGVRAIFDRYVQKPNGGSESHTQIEHEDVVCASMIAGNVDATGWPSLALPHLALWCYLRPRDEAGSKLLRAIDTATAERLLGGGTLDGIEAPELAAAVAAIAKQATELRDRLAKLSTATEGEVSAGGAVLTDTAVQSALGAFLDNRWSASVISEEIEAVSERLLGGPERRAPLSQIPWLRFVGRLRGLAVFAMLPATSKESREAIAQLLRVFAPTIFATGKHSMRVFEGHIAPTSPMKPPGVQSWTYVHEGSSFALRAHGRIDDASEGWRATVVELRSDDRPFVAPPGLTLSHERTIPRVDDTAFLTAFAAVAAKEPPAWDPAAAEAFSAATGLTRGEATLVLAGLPNLTTYASDFLGKELREKLGLKTADAKIARESVRALPKEKLLEVLSRGAPDDPNDLVRPWSESGLAQRLGRAFAEVFGARVTLREDVVIACERELDPRLPSSTLLAAVASETEPPFFQRPPSDLESLFRWQSVPPNNALSTGALQSIAGLVSWLYLAFPAGDPYRDAVPRLMTAVDRALADPALVLPLRQMQVDIAKVAELRAIMDTVTGEPANLTYGNDAAERGCDSGGYIAGTFRTGQMGVVAFRPGKVGPDDPIGRALAAAPISSWGAGSGEAWNAVALLRSPGLRAIVDRIASGKLAAGAYEANPLASAPALVAKVAKATKLSEESSVHYLQLLGLPEPTSKSVQLWNGWKPAQYKKTCDELLAKKLVVTGKRERAGREVFLPGAWEKGQNKALPMEGWKKALYPTSAAPVRILPARPLPDIWADAWKRIEAGDVPKLEEV